MLRMAARLEEHHFRLSFVTRRGQNQKLIKPPKVNSAFPLFVSGSFGGAVGVPIFVIHTKID